MNVVVLGAGTVGKTVAEMLCNRGINVCVIDEQADVLRRVSERLDVQTVCGSAFDVSKLFQAGIQLADLCLAVTSRDEVNLVSASIAREMGASRCVARVFNPIFRDKSTFDYQRHFKVDRLISLEHLTALELAKHIRSTSVLAVESFARGGVDVHGIQVGRKAKAVGVPLHQLNLPQTVRVGLIVNAERSVIPGGYDAVQPGDHVTLIGTHGELEKIASLFEDRASESPRVVIAGGGEIGLNLARLLERTRCRVTVMEQDPDRCDFIAERLPRCTVLHADVKSRADLEEARVGKSDVFVACTGRDEENIVCGVESKELGSKRLLTIVRSPDYANVLERLGIDVAVSPREAMARQIMGLVGKGPVRERSPIIGDTAEVWEVEIRKGVPATKAPLRDLSLPQSLVAAIERGDYVKVPNADDQLKAGDTAILLVQKQSEAEILKMFS
ncbi:Trk system potassium transporter TrkA [Fuerstiella marisgermanici]|uniref:Trk system potassium uptake protein TrkA n=1 Tax=Fuerstiella marisgermanici TaxID=1891926 RepID=A0A1P8WGH5_9PLAN|nr:Trk system potassium transporter TrkA [Fuerstiella marisgermanici]APZ93137.1 Trk system potassium uptake protein TrkA [Fuerstiella marisgermanici]